MFRLFIADPYKKTPLFPKKPGVIPQKEDDDEYHPDSDKEKEESGTNEEGDKKDEVKDNVERIPVIFRSFKKSDLFTVDYRFDTQILMDMSGRSKPEINNIFSDITKEMEVCGKSNVQLYSSRSNAIVYIFENPVSSYYGLYPILVKYDNQGNGQFQWYPYISVPIVMKNLYKNHEYLSILGSRLQWESYSIKLEQVSKAAIQWGDEGMKCMIDIPIEYVSFSKNLDHICIYTSGLRNEWRLMKTENTYREK